jgi:squalene-associated FAD-dependent desaturase
VSAPHVVVVGGGLAGIAAALDCADAGARVTLVERRRRLGGLTWSYEREGRWIDNGQHVFLRCCTAYLDWLGRIGSAGDVELQRRLDVTVLRAAQGTTPRRARLHRNDLPAPLHLAAALLRFGHLPWPDRLRIGMAAIPLRRVDPGDPAADRETFGAWLARHGQSPHAIAALWDLITVATVNLPAAEASLAMGAKVFRTGLLGEAGAADIGWARIPLGQLHGDRARAALGKANAEIITGARVDAVAATPSGVAVRLEGARIDADAVVVAVPHTEVAALLPAGALADPAGLAGLGLSPIVDVHLVYDRPVSALPLFAALDSPVQWVFDRTASSGMPAGDGRQYLAVSLSAADEHMGTRPDALAELVAAELRRLLPAARHARILDASATKERAATFRAVPGTGRLRPKAATNIPGIYLAGAWTDTGWPATMEGAVRSGRAAARSALIGAGQTRALPQEVA